MHQPFSRIFKSHIRFSGEREEEETEARQQIE